MGLYNGEKHLADQLDSYIEQSHTSWSLIISDDGSTDSSQAIISDFMRRHPDRRVKLIEGPRNGFAKNFLSMLSHLPNDVDFVAFSDQDDVWLPEKLERSVAQLSGLPNGHPGLICGRTLICDEDLRQLGISPLFQYPPSFQNALVQNIGGGNTMSLNRAAADVVRHATEHVDFLIAHDWSCYQIVAGVGGTVLYEKEPLVLYRQHARNLIGSNISMGDKVRRLIALFRGQLRTWSDVNSVVLDKIKPTLTDANQRSLYLFQSARGGGPIKRIRDIRRSRIYRQTFFGTASLWLAVVFGLF